MYVPRWKEFDRAREGYLAGDAAAGLALGSFYYYGSVGGMNKESAFEIWMKVAAKNARARFLAGRMLYNGDSTAMDEKAGIAMINSAAESGDQEAAAYLTALPVHLSGPAGEFPSMMTRVDDVIARQRTKRTAEKQRPKWEKDAILAIESHSKKADATDYQVAGTAYMYGGVVAADHAKARALLLRSKGMADPCIRTHKMNSWHGSTSWIETKIQALSFGRRWTSETSIPGRAAYISWL